MSRIISWRSHFKSTDRNGYIPVDSCHHNAWLKSLPRSQLLRLRCNCTNVSDFVDQSLVIKHRFIDKGYVAKDIDVVIQNVLNIEICCGLRGSTSKMIKSSNGLFFTTSSLQHRQIKEISWKQALEGLENWPLSRPCTPWSSMSYL